MLQELLVEYTSGQEMSFQKTKEDWTSIVRSSLSDEQKEQAYDWSHENCKDAILDVYYKCLENTSMLPGEKLAIKMMTREFEKKELNRILCLKATEVLGGINPNLALKQLMSFSRREKNLSVDKKSVFLDCLKNLSLFPNLKNRDALPHMMRTLA